MARARSPVPASILAAAALGCAACYELPVRERVEVRFGPGGDFEARVVTRISESAENPAVRERLDEIRGLIERREDRWTRGLRALEPSVERLSYEFRDGSLTAAERRAESGRLETLPRLFSEIPVAVYAAREESLVTLEITPGGSNRATDRQERKVRESLDGFAASVAAYQKAAGDLYRHLEKRPERARPCFAAWFGEYLDEPAGGEEDLDPKESELLDALADAAGEATKFVFLQEGEAHTLEELSQLVYNPFPAPIEIEVSGGVEESAGFERIGERRFAIPEIGLYDALWGIEGEWIAPDPVLALMDVILAELRGEEEDPKIDLDRFLGVPRLVRSTPDAAAVRAALEARLRPAEVYRLRWRLPAGGGEAAPEAAPPS
jgi:hypothetical protein